MEICQATSGISENEKFEQLHYMMTYTKQVCARACVLFETSLSIYCSETYFKQKQHKDKHILCPNNFFPKYYICKIIIKNGYHAHTSESIH